MEKLVVALKATSALPVQVAGLALKHWRGKEAVSATTTMQRLGISYDTRSPGPLIWFHASTFGECAVALPVLFRCLLEYNEKVAVMLTTASVEAYNMLRSSLPPRVIVQMMPLDNAVCVSLFMRRWRPTVGILVESPFSPQLVLLAAAFQVKLALINAHIEPSDLHVWHAKRHLRSTLGSMLDKFALIIPQSDVDVGRFRIFGATMKQMPGWCNELKYAALMGNSVWHLWKPADMALLQLKEALAGRPTWLAANTVQGEEEVVGRLHLQLAPQLCAAKQPSLVTVVVPQDSGRCQEVAQLLAGEMGLRVAIWSMQDSLSYANMDILLVDDARQLPMFYRMCEITLMGNSLVEGCSGHSLAQAAVAGTALLLGPHAGSSEHMAEELNNAAVMAAEDAAAAVRSTGQVMDDGGWDDAPTSPPRSAAHTSQDLGGDEAHGGTAALASRLLGNPHRLVQRHSTGSAFADGTGRPSVSLPGGSRPMLASQLSQFSQFALDSPRTLVSDTDSLCSETSQRQLVRHYFGSSGSGTLSVSPGGSGNFQDGSPRVQALLAGRGPALDLGLVPMHTTTEWLSPRASEQQQPPQQPQQQALSALQGPPSSLTGSLPSSPAVRTASELLGMRSRELGGLSPRGLAGSGRRWDRIFAAVQDAAPWTDGVPTGSRASTPTASGSTACGSSMFGSSPASQRTASPASQRTASPASQRTLSPTRLSGLLPAPAVISRMLQSPFARHSASTQIVQDSDTQTEPVPEADDSKPVTVHASSTPTASMSMVMVAAMVGAMCGVQLAQGSLNTQGGPVMPAAVGQTERPRTAPPVLAASKGDGTFLPLLHTLRSTEASLAGMAVAPSHTALPAAGVQSNPLATSNGHYPVRISANGSVAGNNLLNSRLAAVASAGSLCSSPMATASSTSFADDPALETRAQKLKLTLRHSTWTATSTPDCLSPRLTGTGSPAPAYAPQQPATSQQLMAALNAVAASKPASRKPVQGSGRDSHAANSANGGHAAVASNAERAQTTAATHVWLSDAWGMGEEDDDLASGPEPSSRSAPLLRRESFEFKMSVGSPSHAAHQQRSAENAGSLPLQTAMSMAVPSARHQPSRLSYASGVAPTPFRSGSPPPILATLAALPTVPSASTSATDTVSCSPSLSKVPVSAPGSQPGLNQHNSANSSRSSAGLFHSDPGSPSCSSVRSDRMWKRSDSGSPTNPMRVSVSGWMGDFGSLNLVVNSAALQPLRSAVSAAPGSGLPNYPLASGLHQAANTSLMQAMRVSSYSGPLHPVGSTPVLIGNGSDQNKRVGAEMPVAREYSLSPRPSAADGAEAVQGVEARDAVGSDASSPRIAAALVHIVGSSGGHVSRDNSGSLHSVGSLRNVRTPRAMEAAPSRAVSSSSMPPISPRASALSPPSPRAGSHELPWPGLSIAELQALAANQSPDLEDEQAPPETPTSRMSIINGSMSPFASSVFDRPNPFADSTGLPSRLDSATAEALSDMLMARLAQGQGKSDQPADEDSQPATPTSRLTAMNSVTSPFSTATYDRPNPFALDAGTMDPLRSEDSIASAAGAAGNERLRVQPHAQCTSKDVSSDSLPVPRRSPSWLLQQQAASRSGRQGHGTQSLGGSGRLPLHALATLPEGNSALTSPTSVSTATTPRTDSAPASPAVLNARSINNRFFSQSACRREADAADSKALRLSSHVSAAAASGGYSSRQALLDDESEPETPRFRPRESLDLRSYGSSSSAAWFHSTPQLHFTEQLFDSAQRPRLNTTDSVASPAKPASPESPAAQHMLSGLVAASSTEPLPSPCKASLPPSGVRSSRRAAYQVRSTAAECCAALPPDSAAVQSVLSRAHATAQAITSLAMAASADAVNNWSESDAIPLSPRSPFRKLFDDSGQPIPATIFSLDAAPGSNCSSNGSGSDLLGPDLLNCLANVLTDGKPGSSSSAAEQLQSAETAADGTTGSGAEDRSQLLATTERLVTVLEATLAAKPAPGSSSQPRSASAAGPEQVQLALQELLTLLGPEVLQASSSDSVSGSFSGSGGSLQLDQLMLSDMSASSFASLREYSLRVQSLGVAAALDAAVAMAGLATVVGASQADGTDAAAWEQLNLRVSSASADMGGSSPRLAGTKPSALAAASGTAMPTLDGKPAGEPLVSCYNIPPDTVPLVMPGASGPVLMAAPMEFVTRLSQGSSISTPSSMRSDNSMADILSAVPSLQQLRLPFTHNGSTSRMSATARAGGAGPSVTPHPAPPGTAPVRSAYTRMPTLGDDALILDSAGSSSSSHSSNEGSVTTAPAPALASVSAVATQRLPVVLNGSSTTGSSNGSLFAFVSHMSGPLAATASSTPDAAHPASGITLSPAAQTRPSAQAPLQPALLGRHHQTVPDNTQHASMAVSLQSDWQPTVVDHGSSEKAAWTGTTVASLPHTRAQATATQANGNGPSAFSAVNPSIALAHKTVNGSTSTSCATTADEIMSRTGRAALQPQQPTQQQEQQHAGSGLGLGHRTVASNSQASVPSLASRPAHQQEHRPPLAHNGAAAAQHFVLPATQLSRSTGPAVWHVGSSTELAGALLSLLGDPLERRSRGHAAAQAAAKLASGLVNTVWHVLDDSVITPTLHGYVQTQTPGTGVITHRA